MGVKQKLLFENDESTGRWRRRRSGIWFRSPRLQQLVPGETDATTGDEYFEQRRPKWDFSRQRLDHLSRRLRPLRQGRPQNQSLHHQQNDESRNDRSPVQNWRSNVPRYSLCSPILSTPLLGYEDLD